MVGSNIGTLNVTALTNNGDVMMWTRTGEGDVIYYLNSTISLVAGVFGLKLNFYLKNVIMETYFCIFIGGYATVTLNAY
jgi:hypothetical protein